MLKLSIPNITFLTPVYSDGKKEDHLFCSNIPIHNRQSMILYQNKRERRMHKINSVLTETIEVDLEAVSTQKKERPEFHVGATFVSLYFRKARSNWFEKY